jgi:glyoxylase-like metal-dependent hydrolase (beta-lactamase superfamily II)
MARGRLRSRRAFLGEVGRGTLALAVLAPVVAACGSSDDGADGTDEAAPAEGSNGATTVTTSGAATTDGVAPGSGAEGGQPGTEELRWARADLGFVSAYVLARGNRAAIVDTGVSGSADAIGESLASLGLNYDDVDHVVLTHKHGDHAGSIAEVTARAARATVYAGQADLGEIDADSIVALTGGEDVFGLEMLATPGHTAGHMAVIDHGVGLLVAGDAIFSEDGGVIEGPPRFFEDIPRSRETIRELARLSFNTLLVGHGEPIEGAADTAVAALAASLP